jgi:hypothetical protein
MRRSRGARRVYRSDVAIIMLNYYPVNIVQRALRSVVAQNFVGTWTVYLGFHDRPQVHRDRVRRLCSDLPVHFVEIGTDLVFDARARDRVLSVATNLGNHDFLFFLDDDDEWYPSYLARMTAHGAPFVTCSKKHVIDDATGELATIADDIDYEGMGFRFDLWKDRQLPYYVKQVSDKHIYERFRESYPDHPVVREPLYRVHRHLDSLTFQKTLDRGRMWTRLLEMDRLVVRPTSESSGDNESDCERIAMALEAPLVPAAQVLRIGKAPRLVVSGLSTLKACLDSSGRRDCAPTIVVAIVQQPIADLATMAVASAAIRLLRRADALLLCDPVWVDDYEPINAACLPVGVPSPFAEAAIRDRCYDRAGQVRKQVAILHTDPLPESYLDLLRERLRGVADIVSSLRHASVCWYPDQAEKGWGRPLLEAYEQGLPCVTSSRTSAAKILYGGGRTLVDCLDSDLVAGRLEALLVKPEPSIITESLPFFRRCFGHFYWRNHFVSYLANLIDSSDLARRHLSP